MSPANSTRWCPTPEQLMILEEMYRGGVRTPNASQIQKITAHLSFYGKIEGKNVFYWFQNHKARERQKLRRKLSKQLYQQQLLQEQLCLNQYHDQQNKFLSFSNDSSPAAMHLLSLDKSADYLSHQEGAENAIKQMKYSTWNKVDPPNMYEMPHSMIMRTCSDDWMTMMMMMKRDADHNLPCCSNNKPLKTLELFPITKPNVNDQGTTTSKPTSIFSSTSISH